MSHITKHQNTFKWAEFWHIFMNFSGTVGRINSILFALESVVKDASFDYNKPIIRYNKNFDLRGGLRFFQALESTNSRFLKKMFL